MNVLSHSYFLVIDFKKIKELLKSMLKVVGCHYGELSQPNEDQFFHTQKKKTQQRLPKLFESCKNSSLQSFALKLKSEFLLTASEGHRAERPLPFPNKESSKDKPNPLFVPLASHCISWFLFLEINNQQINVN